MEMTESFGVFSFLQPYSAVEDVVYIYIYIYVNIYLRFNKKIYIMIIAIYRSTGLFCVMFF